MDWGDKVSVTKPSIQFQSNPNMKIPSEEKTFQASTIPIPQILPKNNIVNANDFSRSYIPLNDSSEKPDRLLESPSQNCPKKRGGFQITNVEDIDEEESEDEDTTYALSSSNDCVESGSFNPSPSLHKFHTLTSTVVDRQLQNGHLGFLTNSEKIQVTGTQETSYPSRSRSNTASLYSKLNGYHHEEDSIIKPLRQPPVSKPQVQESMSINQISSNSVIPNSSAPLSARASLSSSSTPLKTGASRVYKVVKREASFPIKRDVARWISIDYSDAQIPNYKMIAQPHLELPSLNQPDSVNILNNSTNTSLSAKTNSRLDPHHIEGLKNDSRFKSVFKFPDSSNEKFVKNEERTSDGGSSDQDVNKNALLYSDGASVSETDEESSISPHLRIDNKIEAAMDLVKNHLMLAVRDEVDELKERIVELQSENEAMKEILTVDQRSRLQLSLNRSFKSNSKPVFQSQNSNHVTGSTAHNHMQLAGHDQGPKSALQFSTQSNNSTHQVQSNTSNSFHTSRSHLNSMPLQIPVSVGNFQPNQPIYQQLSSKMSPPLISPLEKSVQFASPLPRKTSITNENLGHRQQLSSISSVTSPTYSHPYAYPSTNQGNT